jgi:hypothetical protein
MHQPIQTEAPIGAIPGTAFFVIGCYGSLTQKGKTFCPNEIVKSSISIALKRLSQSFHFKAGAK